MHAAPRIKPKEVLALKVYFGSLDFKNSKAILLIRHLQIPVYITKAVLSTGEKVTLIWWHLEIILTQPFKMKIITQRPSWDLSKLPLAGLDKYTAARINKIPRTLKMVRGSCKNSIPNTYGSSIPPLIRKREYKDIFPFLKIRNPMML